MNINISSKKDFLMISLSKFFNKKENINILKPIISGKSNISLRVIDWFVTNYSKKFGTSFNLKNSNFIIYIDYKSQLKAYSKKQFDPFCRRERIIFNDYNNEEIVTTVGQLNFFRWAITNNIIKYIENNIKIIEKDMIDSLKNIYPKNGKKKKRKELSLSAVKTIKKHNVSIIVDFN
jgi:hypothetical protein